MGASRGQRKGLRHVMAKSATRPVAVTPIADDAAIGADDALLVLTIPERLMAVLDREYEAAADGVILLEDVASGLLCDLLETMETHHAGANDVEHAAGGTASAGKAARPARRKARDAAAGAAVAGGDGG